MLRIIGNMTGNSMDAIDLVLTEFDGNKMHDICTYTKPYTKNFQVKIDKLRQKVFNKSKEEILSIPEFRNIHDSYIQGIAKAINEMCALNNIKKTTIDAIGFHGKTLDHNPPSKAKKDHTLPYTLQLGSGQMLADILNIPVVYDFRSDLLMAGYEGAPLVLPHNAHIAQTQGDGCYYNGGNTSNFAIITHKKAVIGADSGPFNEYIDNYVRLFTSESYDKNGKFGKKGTLDQNLLQKLFDFGRNYYETKLPKSGDPAYYHKKEIFEYIQKANIKFEDTIHTLEYFASYIAVQALTLVPENFTLPKDIFLFGGGWKNPIVRKSFEDIINNKSFILPEHERDFNRLKKRIGSKINIQYSTFGEYMEARLFADMARYKLENKAWEIPEVLQDKQNIVCGIIAKPQTHKKDYTDFINRAAKNW